MQALLYTEPRIAVDIALGCQLMHQSEPGFQSSANQLCYT